MLFTSCGSRIIQKEVGQESGKKKNKRGGGARTRLEGHTFLPFTVGVSGEYEKQKGTCPSAPLRPWTRHCSTSVDQIQYQSRNLKGDMSP